MKTERFPIDASGSKSRARRVATKVPGASYSYLELRHLLREREGAGVRPIGFGLAKPVLDTHAQLGAVAVGLLPIAGPLLSAMMYGAKAGEKRVLVLTPDCLHVLPMSPQPLTLMEAVQTVELHELAVELARPRGGRRSAEAMLGEQPADPGRKAVFSVTPVVAEDTPPRGLRGVVRSGSGSGLGSGLGPMRFVVPAGGSVAARALREGLAAIAGPEQPAR